MTKPRHSCARSEAAEDHSPVRLFTPVGHRFPACSCHGHCGSCGHPVMQCKMGKFHHKANY